MQIAKWPRHSHVWLRSSVMVLLCAITVLVMGVPYQKHTQSRNLSLPLTGIWDLRGWTLNLVTCKNHGAEKGLLYFQASNDEDKFIAERFVEIPASGTVDIKLNDFDAKNTFGTYRIKAADDASVKTQATCYSVFYREASTDAKGMAVLVVAGGEAKDRKRIQQEEEDLQVFAVDTRGELSSSLKVMSRSAVSSTVSLSLYGKDGSSIPKQSLEVPAEEVRAIELRDALGADFEGFVTVSGCGQSGLVQLELSREAAIPADSQESKTDNLSGSLNQTANKHVHFEGAAFQKAS